jgi:DNA primase
MRKNDVGKIKRVLTCDAVLKNRGFTPGRSMTCPLPGHPDGKPSFGTFANGKAYKCFGCDRGGDVLSLIQELEQCTFKEAIEMAKKEGNICD